MREAVLKAEAVLREVSPKVRGPHRSPSGRTGAELQYYLPVPLFFFFRYALV